MEDFPNTHTLMFPLGTLLLSELLSHTTPFQKAALDSAEQSCSSFCSLQRGRMLAL